MRANAAVSGTNSTFTMIEHQQSMFVSTPRMGLTKRAIGFGVSFGAGTTTFSGSTCRPPCPAGGNEARE